MLHKLGAGLYAKLMAEVDAHVGAQLQLLAVRPKAKHSVCGGA